MPSSAEPPYSPSPTRGPAVGAPTEDAEPEASGHPARPGTRVPSPRRPGGPPALAPEPGTERRRFWLSLLPTLAALTVITRLPSFARTLWNPDEGFVATQARQLADGGVLYDTVVDRKPPLLPWLYQGAFALFGADSLWPLRVVAIVAVLLGAVLIASMGRHRWGAVGGWSAGVLFVLVSVGLNPEDTQAASFGLFMMVWTVLAMWCAERGHWAAAGLALAGAVLTKQTGGAVLLPMLFVLWRSRAGWVAAARLLAGSALPVLAVAVAYGPATFLYWMATGSGSYASVKGAGTLALVRAVGSGALLVLALLPVLCALGYVLARRRRELGPMADLLVWLGASAMAVTVGFQFFGHYFLQLVPALALIGAGALAALSARRVMAVLAATAVIASGYMGWGFLADRTELDHAHRVALAVRDRTAPDEPVLLWGMHPEGYWLAQRPPASRYLTAGFLTNFSGGRGGVRVGEQYAMEGAWPYFRRELAENPPAVVVDDARGAAYGIERTPTLRAVLERDYERTDTIGGAVFYVRTAIP
ncbi:glycosyltransferase [Streptomyces sp. AJS327]|uniref:ArnT family glycosyltransferase n=1 Tax=Streptomyces sp. AJS327 TaxID=2545265 RepID=UPI0015E051BA|nr:glycosyltransferase family 39 protein [Streptomyces sp. AJS327]MBA0052052.1 glycosyltransferase [Streptomyces sp. AJS327]